MKSYEKKVAVVLLNLGGPDKISSVKPFLFNFFNDEAIISLFQPLRFFVAKILAFKKASKIQKNYEQVGRKSPLQDIMFSQAHSLEHELSFFGNFKVFIAMRHWHPFVHKTIKEIKEYQPNQIILLPLYPQFSSSTTKSLVENFLQKFSQDVPIKTICCYPTDPAFIRSHTTLIKRTIAHLYEDNIENFRFLFFAHNITQKSVSDGNPYIFQVTKTAEKLVESLSKNLNINKKIDFRICYQSKIIPLQYTSLHLNHELHKAVLDKKTPVIIPISFVSESLETIFELDIRYKNLAKILGIKKYLRVPTLNIEGSFIKALAEMCKEPNKEHNRICPNKFKLCLNSNHCRT